MDERRAPLRESLRDTLSESDIQRAWHGVQARRYAQGPWPRQAWGGLVLGAALASLLLVLGLSLRPSPATHAPALAEAPPLRAEEGPLPEVLSAPEQGAARQVALSDGSRLELEPGAHAEVLDNTGRSFVTLLKRGRARFDVRPGGPRRWTVECSVATVEVVGTRFALQREGGRLSVEVEHGVVLVRGEHVPERVQRLTAGQRLEVHEPPRPASRSEAPEETEPPEEAPAAEAPSAESPTAEPLVAEAPAAEPPTAPSPRWQALARRGDHAAAYERLGRKELRRQALRTRNLDTLLLLADVARHSGHPREAAAVLWRAVRLPRKDARTGLAAFTLGQLELESLERPAHAARAFRLLIELGEPRGLVEDAHARLVQALVAAGEPLQAQQVAEQYARRYPQGHRLEDIRRWLPTR